MAQTFYTPFPVDHTKCGSANSSNFPVVLTVTDNRFKTVANGGHGGNASGFDIRPYSDAGLTSAYTYQLRNYNATTGALELVVLIPTLLVTVDTPIYVGYGDVALTTDGSSTSVWDANFKGVYHFGSPTVLSLADSTSNANNGSGVNTPTAATGLNGGGLGLNGSSQYVNLPTGVINGSTFTISALFNATSSVYQDLITQWSSGAAGRLEFGFNTSGSGTLALFLSGSPVATSSGTIGTGGWHRITATRDGSNNIALYIDGSPDGTGSSATTVFSTTTRIGSYSGGAFFGGVIDEVRLSSSARSPSWITAEANNSLNSTGVGGFAPKGTESAISSGTTAASGCGVLTLAGFAPAVSATNNQVVTAGVGALTLAGFAPTAGVSNNQSVLPGVGAGVLSGFAPTVLTPRSVLPGVGAAVLTGFAPSVAAGTSALPGAGTVTLVGFAPTVSLTNNKTVLPGVGAVTLTGFTPTVTAPQTLRPGVGVVLLLGFAPTATVSTPPAHITLAGEVRDVTPAVRVRVLDITPNARQRTF